MYSNSARYLSSHPARFIFKHSLSSDFDQHELNLYEEVAKMPPFDRKTLVLIGAQGVGRRSLISKLVLNEPDKFGNTMPRKLLGDPNSNLKLF